MGDFFWSASNIPKIMAEMIPFPAHPLIAGRDHMLWRRRWSSQDTCKCWKDRRKVLEFFRNWPQMPRPLIITHTHTHTQSGPPSSCCHWLHTASQFFFLVWQVDIPRNPSFCSRSCASCQEPLRQEV